MDSRMIERLKFAVTFAKCVVDEYSGEAEVTPERMYDLMRDLHSACWDATWCFVCDKSALSPDGQSINMAEYDGLEVELCPSCAAYYQEHCALPQIHGVEVTR